MKRAPPHWAAGALEPLVLVSAALAGPRAPALLDGLVAPLDGEARGLLEVSDAQATPEQHARWLRVFRRGPAPAASDIPGRLGALVRMRLADGGPVLAESETPTPAWVRWSSRLALEQRDADVGLGSARLPSRPAKRT